MEHPSQEAADECARTPVPEHTFKIGDTVPIPYLDYAAFPVIALVAMPASQTHERFIVLGTTPEPEPLTEEVARRFIQMEKNRRS